MLQYMRHRLRYVSYMLSASHVFVIECKSWVWKANTEECFLKNDYDPSRNDIECSDCVAYSEEGKHYVYSISVPGTPGGSSVIGDYHTWAQEGGIWMPEYVAKQLCTIKEGFDQPEKYNIDDRDRKSTRLNSSHT